MIDTKNFQIRKVDNVDGSVNCEVGILVKAKHVIPAARVLKLAVRGENHVEMECRAQVRPLKAAVLNHIYGDLTALVAAGLTAWVLALVGAALIGHVLTLPRFSMCTFQNLFGRPCPGCGMSRSFANISQLSWGDALGYHPFGLVFYPLVVFLALANLLGVRRPVIYFVGGGLVWLAMLGSGVHATLAGILVALTVPARPRHGTRSFLHRSRRLIDEFEAIEAKGRKAAAPILAEPEKHAVVEQLQDTAAKAAQAIQDAAQGGGADRGDGKLFPLRLRGSRGRQAGQRLAGQ